MQRENPPLMGSNQDKLEDEKSVKKSDRLRENNKSRHLKEESEQEKQE